MAVIPTVSDKWRLASSTDAEKPSRRSRGVREGAHLMYASMRLLIAANNGLITRA
jgi:hypothetical protein